MSPSRLASLMVALLLLGAVGCRGAQAPAHPLSEAPGIAPGNTARAPAPAPVPQATPMPIPPAATAPAVPAAVQAQIDRGVVLFAQNCSSCHGGRGEGTVQAPALVGEGTLPLDPPAGARVRRVKFQSAMDLGMFIKDNMPPNGAHLPPRDVACVLAWLLKEHGRTPTAPISPATAGAIQR